jgi:hypothetical protein
MRFFERILVRNEKVRELQRKPEAWANEVHKSVISQLQNNLNFRKQPGALEHSNQYEKWFPALSQLDNESHWSLLQEYVEAVEPRLEKTVVRKLKPVEKKQGESFARTLSELEQKATVLFAIETQIKESERINNAQLKLVAIQRPNGRLVLFSLG